MLTFMTQAILYRERFEIEDGHQPQNAFFFVESGSFYCKFDDSDAFIAEAGDLIVFPLSSHFIRKILEPCRLHLIYFRVDWENPLSKYFPQGPLHFQDKKRIQTDKAILYNQIKFNDPASLVICSHYLNDIFMLYFEEAAPISGSRRTLSPLITSLTDYMIAELNSRITLEELATRCNMSKNGLIKRFQNETGFPPMQYLVRLRMQKALRLLLGSQESISSIAISCGYDNIFYFSNSFKKMHGISPSEFRRELPKV